MAMRNPNGYGSISKLSGKRRNPFRVRKLIGYTSEGKAKYLNIGYFPSRPEALIALAEFNKNPYDLKNNDITFKDIYEKWKEYKYPTISEKAVKNYITIYQKCVPLENIKFKELKTIHLQEIIKRNTYSNKHKLRTLFSQLFNFAMKNDIVNKDYSAFVDIGKRETVIERKVFTDEDRKILWDNINIPYVDCILIMMYSSLRIGELLKLKKENINLKEKIIIGGSKTEAGKNRVIPIHTKIYPLIAKRYNQSSLHLIETSTGKMSYQFFWDIFKDIMKTLNMEHTIHDCRHTFATKMTDAGANQTATKKIIGHSSFATTEKIYTHASIEILRENIEKI